MFEDIGKSMVKVMNLVRYVMIVTLCFLMIVITSLKHVWSVFIPSVEKEFLVSRSVSVLPFSLLNIANIAGFLSTSYIKEILGIKRLLAITGVLMSAGLLLAALSPNIIFLIISYAFIYGLGNSFAYVIAVSLGVKWFSGTKRAGIITGIIVSAYSLGMLILSPLTTYLIQYFSSWRVPLLIYSICAASVMTASAILLSEPPSESISTSKGFTEIIKSKEYLLIASVLFLTTLFDGLIVSNLVPLVKEVAGADPMTASIIMSIYSVVAVISRVVVGAISEYLGIARTLITIYVIELINALLFKFYTTIPLVTIGVSMSAILFSANVTLTPLIASSIWGRNRLEAAYSLLLTALVCGVLVGPLIGGISRDLTGNYYPGIYVATLLLLIGLVILIKTMKYIPVKPSYGSVL